MPTNAPLLDHQSVTLEMWALGLVQPGPGGAVGAVTVACLDGCCVEVDSEARAFALTGSHNGVGGHERRGRGHGRGRPAGWPVGRAHWHVAVVWTHADVSLVVTRAGAGASTNDVAPSVLIAIATLSPILVGAYGAFRIGPHFRLRRAVVPTTSTPGGTVTMTGSPSVPGVPTDSESGAGALLVGEVHVWDAPRTAADLVSCAFRRFRPDLKTYYARYYAPP